jgi:NAD(P)-dependent dehydrogenase (short-subunit alcohol dehydrogenase family)
MKPPATPGIRQDAEATGWREHRFGLPADRWASIAGRSVWVTGAGTGYGRSIAAALAAGGGRVFLTGRRETKLRGTQEQIARLGADADRGRPMVCDLTDDRQLARACRCVREGCGALDGLVHCAALPPERGRDRPLIDGPREYWDRLMATNVTAAWLLSRQMLPHMLAGGHVRIVLVTSGAGWGFTPGFGVYNVSKAALNSLGGCLGEEFAAAHPDGDIQVNVLDPGEARTEMNPGAAASPYAVVAMTLALLTHPAGGPNGMYFHRDGRHLSFCGRGPYRRSLL